MKIFAKIFIQVQDIHQFALATQIRPHATRESLYPRTRPARAQSREGGEN